ncbi:MAG TPA: HAMP domain-containing sensor histidine kinase [Actinoplanes sp.]|nr:HAMP domain-containing sensor histidine kinase [Actinoplanes sp.]
MTGPFLGSLRVRLLGITLVLLTAGLVISGALVAGVLRRHLVDRVDRQVSALAQLAARIDPALLRALDETGRARLLDGLDLVSDIDVIYLDGAGRVFHHTGTTRDGDSPAPPPADIALGGPRTPEIPGVPGSTDIPGVPGAPGGLTTGGTIGAVPRAGPESVDGADGSPWRRVVIARDDGVVAVSASLTAVDGIVDRSLLTGAITGAILVVVLGAGGWLAIRAAFRPLRAIEETAAGIAAGNLGLRIPSPGTTTTTTDDLRVPNRNNTASAAGDLRMPGRNNTATGDLRIPGGNNTAMTAGDLLIFGRGSAGSETEHLTAVLNGMLDRIEEGVAARAESEARMRRFVADVSHELRTPLFGIAGSAELYLMAHSTGSSPADDAPGRGAGPAAGVHRAMRRIDNEARRLTALVEDLLLLARLDESGAGAAGPAPLDPAPMDLRTLAADAVDDLRALDPERLVTVTGLSVTESSGTRLPEAVLSATSLPGAEPPGAGLPGAEPPGAAPILGDEARLRQVIANLAGNVHAHTPPGSPVRIGVGRDGGDAVFEIADSGPGIPPEQVELVFERFHRGDAARSRPLPDAPECTGGTADGPASSGGTAGDRASTDGPTGDRANTGGTADGRANTGGPTGDRASNGGTAGGRGGGAGLGLAIVRSLVGAHGGTVRVLSPPGGGATFQVRIPVWENAPEHCGCVQDGRAGCPACSNFAD